MVSGFNATLTEPVDKPERRGDQIKEIELKLRPDFKETLSALHNDPTTTTVVLSGSDRNVFDNMLVLEDFKHMLQHLWTGPISNASVDVVEGRRSVEVQAVGPTKGAAIDRILGDIVHIKSMTSPH
ncbi:alpha,alpha-trehalose-phosphate synthase 1-like [Pyrus ussuriensis x Pyrus communis]|uniref:Alpha,alpha-trehalose-phosphate synthase 1-like n=1 Tax=Pyrus ussuriensis x Pyrus communis TaxID=2448454 RepID=A0A5N5H6G2_9ROSA|nr:alpha,alpha-trehalose-phosphate synthase 1-like [Pyrus ussuriensis x Pyrus communis]